MAIPDAIPTSGNFRGLVTLPLNAEDACKYINKNASQPTWNGGIGTLPEALQGVRNNWISATRGASSGRYIFNGALGNGQTAGALTAGTTPFTIANDVWNGEFWLGEYHFAAVWNRELNDSELQQQSAEPYSMFWERRRTIFVPLGSPVIIISGNRRRFSRSTGFWSY